MNDEAADKATKKKPPVKTVALVLLMLIVEGVALVGVMMVFGGPSEVQGVTIEGGGDSADASVEIPLLHERFTNLARGVSMVYDTEILLVVPGEHQATVEQMVESKRGQIRAGISRIWRSAEASYFNEPGYETLSRQTEDFLNTLFDSQPEEGRYIGEVLIPKCMGFRNDF
jgi:flagellar basal body-associated protein FliL